MDYLSNIQLPAILTYRENQNEIMNAISLFIISNGKELTLDCNFAENGTVAFIL